MQQYVQERREGRWWAAARVAVGGWRGPFPAPPYLALDVWDVLGSHGILGPTHNLAFFLGRIRGSQRRERGRRRRQQQPQQRSCAHGLQPLNFSGSGKCVCGPGGLGRSKKSCPSSSVAPCPCSRCRHTVVSTQVMQANGQKVFVLCQRAGLSTPTGQEALQSSQLFPACPTAKLITAPPKLHAGLQAANATQRLDARRALGRNGEQRCSGSGNPAGHPGAAGGPTCHRRRPERP